MKIRPVILAGGSGVRLWPLSRETMPKQLLSLNSRHSLFQETLLRVNSQEFLPPIVICNDQYRFLIAEQVHNLGIDTAEIILEPIARNSCAAAAVAALLSERMEPDSIVLLLPSDHAIADVKAFREAVERASAGATAEFLMTFGVVPRGPATEYGYIRVGSPLEGAPGCMRVAAFVEKPDLSKAQRLLTEGGNVWNSGMFVFRPRVFLDELERFEPAVARAAEAALQGAKRDLGFLRLDGDHFRKSPNISIDYAVMERTGRAATCALDAGWSDLGSWAAIWDVADRDQAQNVLSGDVLVEDSRGCLVRSEGVLTAVLGMEDAIVVTTGDAVLVAAKDRAQDVRKIVDQLKAQNRSEYREGLETHRPWGKYRRIDAGERYQVKLITILPGASISLQLHRQRSEHWIVVSGSGKVTRGEENFILSESESTFIPVGVRHRLENAETTPLQIIEVQSGEYLGEDDIVRFDDRYGRGPTGS